MSWSRRALLALLLSAPLALTACGFRPLHGTEGVRSSSVREMEQIKIMTIADRTGQLVHNALLDRLTPKGSPDKPRFLLTVTLSESKQGLGILKDETASRANYIVSAGFSLREMKGSVLYSGSVSSQASYNILSEHYASTVSEKDARDRATDEIAEGIALQLASFFSRQRDARKTAP